MQQAQTPTQAQAPKEQEVAEEKKTPAIPTDERFLAAISYVPPAFVLALITKPDSKFCQFHAKQGLGMFVIDILILFILAIIPAIGSILFLGAIALSAVAIFQGYQGVEWKIPVISNITQKINLNKVTAAPKKEAPAKSETPVTPPQPTPTKQ